MPCQGYALEGELFERILSAFDNLLPPNYWKSINLMTGWRVWVLAVGLCFGLKVRVECSVPDLSINIVI